jgi:hypothetical protein
MNARMAVGAGDRHVAARGAEHGAQPLTGPAGGGSMAGRGVPAWDRADTMTAGQS